MELSESFFILITTYAQILHIQSPSQQTNKQKNFKYIDLTGKSVSCEINPVNTHKTHIPTNDLVECQELKLYAVQIVNFTIQNQMYVEKWWRRTCVQL